MNSQELLETLARNPSVDDLIAVGVLKSTAKLMVQDPQKWIEFIDKRLNYRFETNSDVSAHFKAFMEETGISTYNLKKLILDFDLAVLKLGITYKRENERKASYLEKKNRLDAALRVIRGYGTVYELAKEMKVNYRSLYREVDKLLAEQGIEMSQLNGMFAPERAAVAELAYINENKRLDEFLNKGVTREERYRRKS